MLNRGWDDEESPEPEPLPVTEAQFVAGRRRSFGAENPERDEDPFRLAMIRSGYGASGARRQFGVAYDDSPVWCFDRIGQTHTIFEDRTVISVAGEHEDHYDPDFVIYNDVVLWSASGVVRLFQYPREVFPPTDYHTTTWLWDEEKTSRPWPSTGGHLAIVGNLGYVQDRRPGHTPVYALDLEDLSIAEHRCGGDAPGWISRHRATWLPGRRFLIEGGMVWTCTGEYVPNREAFVLDWDAAHWSRVTVDLAPAG